MNVVVAGRRAVFRGLLDPITHYWETHLEGRVHDDENFAYEAMIDTVREYTFQNPLFYAYEFLRQYRIGVARLTLTTYTDPLACHSFSFARVLMDVEQRILSRLNARNSTILHSETEISLGCE